MVRLVPAALLLTALAALACSGGGSRDSTDRKPIPVEVAEVSFDAVVAERVLAGTLEATASIEVIARVRGRVAALGVDLGDPVSRGQVVALLEDEELEQGDRAAGAAVEVARADVARAEATLTARDRERLRASELSPQGAISRADLDAADDAVAAARASLAAARAQLARVVAERDTARARLSYTRVEATWAEGDASRVVAARHVDEGSTVQPEQPLFTIVDLDPLRAVVSVTERDYIGITAGQAVTLHTDALPERAFGGRVARVAPVFDPGSRQARVEIHVDNPDGALKPGMFVRVRVEVGRSAGDAVVPIAALTARADVPGVFVVDADGRARFRPVGVGLRSGDRAAVRGDGVEGSVVTLGHQELADGVLVHVIAADDPGPP